MLRLCAGSANMQQLECGEVIIILSLDEKCLRYAIMWYVWEVTVVSDPGSPVGLPTRDR